MITSSPGASVWISSLSFAWASSRVMVADMVASVGWSPLIVSEFTARWWVKRARPPGHPGGLVYPFPTPTHRSRSLTLQLVAAAARAAGVAATLVAAGPAEALVVVAAAGVARVAAIAAIAGVAR